MRPRMHLSGVLLCCVLGLAHSPASAQDRTAECLQQLRQGDFSEAYEASQALVKLGDAALVPLVELLNERNGQSGLAFLALCDLPQGVELLPQLLDFLVDPDLQDPRGWPQSWPHRRQLVAKLRKKAEWPRHLMVPALTLIARNDRDHDSVRSMATWVLSDVGAEEELRTLTEDDSHFIRFKAHVFLAGLLARTGKTTRVDYFTRLVAEDPLHPNVPQYLVRSRGQGNFGRLHPPTGQAKKALRERLAEQQDPELAMTLALVIQGELTNTEIEWATPADRYSMPWPRGDPSVTHETLREALELGLGLAEAGSEIHRAFGAGLAKLCLVQGDFEGMNEALRALGQEPIRNELLPWLAAPPKDWSRLSEEWLPCDEDLRTGNGSVVVRVESADGEGLAGMHVLLKPAPVQHPGFTTSGIPTNTLFFETECLAHRWHPRSTFGYAAPDRTSTRYGFTDESGEVRFDGLPEEALKLELLVPTANIEHHAGTFDLWIRKPDGTMPPFPSRAGDRAVTPTAGEVLRPPTFVIHWR